MVNVAQSMKVYLNSEKFKCVEQMNVQSQLLADLNENSNEYDVDTFKEKSENVKKEYSRLQGRLEMLNEVIKFCEERGRY